MKLVTTTAILIATLATNAYAGSVSIPNTFTAGTPAVAAEVNSNFSAVATAVNDNATSISNVTSTANSNAIGVAANSSNITLNSNAISSNATAISNNTTAINAIDTSGIATNASAISTLSGEIVTNMNDISTNATAISDNATAISAIDTSGIATNATNITANADAITQNTSDIAALGGVKYMRVKDGNGNTLGRFVSMGNAFVDTGVALNYGKFLDLNDPTVQTVSYMTDTGYIVNHMQVRTAEQLSFHQLQSDYKDRIYFSGASCSGTMYVRAGNHIKGEVFTSSENFDSNAGTYVYNASYYISKTATMTTTAMYSYLDATQNCLPENGGAGTIMNVYHVLLNDSAVTGTGTNNLGLGNTITAPLSITYE